jgi:chemotaxis protein CheZ
MDIVERQMETQAAMAEKLAGLLDGEPRPDALAEVAAANEVLGQDLMTIMTALSFQDLTGQRIKRVIAAVKQIESITFDLFVSTGLKIKAKEQNPEKDMVQLDAEARQRVSTLKGPQNESSQADVDDLMAQLGLE